MSETKMKNRGPMTDNELLAAAKEAVRAEYQAKARKLERSFRRIARNSYPCDWYVAAAKLRHAFGLDKKGKP